MSDVIIQVENISKRYNIGSSFASYKTLRDSITEVFTSPSRLFRSTPTNEIWALRDVSFEVKKGEVIGIIGHNGAGKSTLLKILSRITKPTKGMVRMRGRVGSLLEVGTGFHPELTGRENIFLNGAILGMPRLEIDRRFDEIVEFSEIDKFLDTPVKYYSSGMYMRLAFSVAAHLQPDILIVDEVLAVGDISFQKKCLGKMEDVSHEGRTVLFVSHNLAAVLNLCSRGVLLESGRIKSAGQMKMVVEDYINTGVVKSGEVVFPIRESDVPFSFVSSRIQRPNGEVTALVDLMEGFILELTYQIHQPLKGVKINFQLCNSSGHTVLSSGDIDKNPLILLNEERKPGVYRVRCHVSRQFLRPGRYTINIWAGIPGVKTLDEHFQKIAFDVEDTGSTQALIAEGSNAIITPILDWEKQEFLEAGK